MRNAIHAFDEGGLEKALSKGSSRPDDIHAAFDAERAERLRELLHRSPRDFGKPTSLWTLELAAEVSFEEGEPPRLEQRSVAKDDPDPKAVSCYGLYLPEFEQTWLRFVDGRPVSGITTRFLSWCSEKLRAAGKKVWVLVWDNASWHVSKEVRRWIGEHNRQVKKGGKACGS